jgi:ABC-2 type transport system permease protein
MILLIIWKEFLHIKKDKMMIRLIIFPVFIQLFVIGYALTTEVKHTSVAVLDNSRSPKSRELIASIKKSDLFNYKGLIETPRQARVLLDRGKVKVVFIIPAEFQNDLAKPQGAKVQVLSDGQDANSSAVATGYLNAIINTWTMSEMKKRTAAQGIPIERIIPVKTYSTILFNPMLKSSWYMIPGLVVLLVTIITSLLTGFSIVNEKERGTMEQLLVTPIKPIQILIGKIVPFAVIGLFEIVIFLLIAILYFRIPFLGSFPVLFSFALMYMMSSLGIGILVSSVAGTSQQVLFITWFFLIFFILLSGFFIPVENMPGWVQGITNINPVRFFMLVVREIFLKGAGFAELWRAGLSMMGIGVFVFGLALIFFTKKAA